jgi:hypothetical protein
MKTAKDRGIVRIDQPEKYNHGWWVRRRRGAKMFSKFFADKKHGGKNKARVFAREYNDELTNKLPPVSRRRSSSATSSSASARMKAKAGATTRRSTNTGRSAAGSKSKNAGFAFGRATQLPRARRRFAVSK